MKRGSWGFGVAIACAFAGTQIFSLRLPKVAKFNNCKLMSSFDADGAEDVFGAGVGPLPSVSSRVNWGDMTPQAINTDLWIVGAGTLGMSVARLWRRLNPSATICAETKTTSRHDHLSSMGVTPRLREFRSSEDDMSARNVLVCLPPSSSKDYVEEIHLACRLWAGPLGNGNLVFTSSTAVYGESIGNVVNEKFRLDTRSLRATKLITAEEAVLGRDGCVLRLAGLYDAERGPHTYWLRNGTIQGSADTYINMLHYDDAAEACVAALRKGKLQGVYLAADDAPVSRKEICEAALASGLFPQWPMPTFTLDVELQSKIVDDSITRSELGWKPNHKNFMEHMVTTIGGKSFTLPKDPRRPDPRALKEKEAKKSALWIPGDDDIF